MKLRSASIYALLLPFVLLGSFFIAPVGLGKGEGEIFSLVQASFRALIGEAKLDAEGWVSPPEGQSRVAITKFWDPIIIAPSLADSVLGMALVIHEDFELDQLFLLVEFVDCIMLSVSLDYSEEPGTALVIHEDGKFELKDTGSGATLWIISTNKTLTSQSEVSIPINSKNFVFPGAGAELFVFTKSAGIEKHPLSIREYVGRTPLITSTTITMGSKSSMVYRVDPNNGDIIFQSSLPANVSHFEMFMTEDQSCGTMEKRNSEFNHIIIIRTDYSVSSSDISGTLWNWTVSFFAAYYPNMLKPPHTGGTIPIEFKGNGQLLAWPFDESAHSSGDDNGHVPGPAYPINAYNENLANSRAILLFLGLIGCLVLLWMSLKKFGRKKQDTSESQTERERERDRGKKKGAVIIDGTGGTLAHDSDIDNPENLFKRDGKQVGTIWVTTNEVGRGSNGTIVLDGEYAGKPVAVKRLLLTHDDVAVKEFENLLASDNHPNIVRLYGLDKDPDFVYIALEKCTCNLADLILYCAKEGSDADFGAHFSASGKGVGKDLVLWRENGLPSTQLIKLMRDVVFGLEYLHELGMIHRDLKPRNVLISTGRVLQAKLSDMGISKKLEEDMSSLSDHDTGYGSSGWQAPERLLHDRQNKAVDLFSLGCILFFCVTKGKHPYGENHFERDQRIIENKLDLSLVDFMPEAVHLFELLLHPKPAMRPTAMEVLRHPFFWNAELRISFLRDTSDRIQSSGPQFVTAIESVASVVFGKQWANQLDPALIADLRSHRRYNFKSVRDLLRVIRNKSGHYQELSTQLQVILGSLPEEFDQYFATKFPQLLIEIYKIVCTHCREEDAFKKYFKSNIAC